MPKVLKVSTGGVPAGTYIGPFLGVEDVEADAQRGYGPGLKWLFQIAKGELAGQQATRITTAIPTQKNACGRMLNGLLGRALQPGEAVDVQQFVGKTYLLIVAAGENGGTRVETVSAPPV